MRLDSRAQVPTRRVLYENGTITTVFFFHGNLPRYPPDHELYDTEITLPIPSKKDGHCKVVNTKERFDKTSTIQLFVDQGYKVCYLWSMSTLRRGAQDVDQGGVALVVSAQLF